MPLVTDVTCLFHFTDQYPEKFAQLFHSLDIWQKSAKLSKALSEASKIKGCEDLPEWIAPIRNHFWHCFEASNGDLERLKDTWLGITHHVQGEHKCVDGECSHGPLAESDQTRSVLKEDSPAIEALKKIVYDPRWIKSLGFYVLFRYNKNTFDMKNLNHNPMQYFMLNLLLPDSFQNIMICIALLLQKKLLSHLCLFADQSSRIKHLHSL